MRADVRQGDSSYSVDWCDDPFSLNLLRNARAADVLRSNLVTPFLHGIQRSRIFVSIHRSSRVAALMSCHIHLQMCSPTEKHQVLRVAQTAQRLVLRLPALTNIALSRD